MRIDSLRSRRWGMSLLEVLAAVILSSMIAMTGLMFIQGHGRTTHDRSCQAHRARLQNDVELFVRETGKTPDKILESIRTVSYSGTVLPACPQHAGTDGRTNYRWDGSNVICDYHPE